MKTLTREEFYNRLREDCEKELDRVREEFSYRIREAKENHRLDDLLHAKMKAHRNE